MIVDRKKFLMCVSVALSLILYIYILINLRGYSNSDLVVKISCISSLIILILECSAIYQQDKRLFTPTIMILAAFYLFQNGQLLLLALGIEFNDFYISTLKQYSSDVAIYSSISNVLTGFAALIMTKPVSDEYLPRKARRIDELTPEFIEFAAKVGVILTGVVTIPLVLIKTYIGMGGGYSAVRTFESGIPSVFNFIEYMFMPFAVLMIVYAGKERNKPIKIAVAVWAILTALCGDRTTGIGALVVLIFLSYLQAEESSEEDKPSTGKKMVRFLLIIFLGVLLLLFIQIAYAVRTKGDLNLGSFSGLITDTISDLGFSCFPLFTMMNIVPAFEAFQLGKGYVLSMIGGLIPSFIDVTGTIGKINQQSRIFETWQTQYYSQYNFGLGFSLNAESYINFGWFGLIAIFVLMLVVFGMLNSCRYDDETDQWGRYKICILVFLWFTLPRRDSYYVWKAISYSIIIMYLYLRFMRSMGNAKNGL